jgi:hypothetical protein
MSNRALSLGFPQGALRILVVVFVLAAAGSLALVAVDLLVHRPAAGDVFIAVINSIVATVLWRELAKQGNRPEST